MSKFCIDCGNEILNGAKFCGSCGKQQNEQNQINNNEPTQEEEILGMFPSVTTERGFYHSYRLVFTTNRLIVAKEKRLLPRAPLAPYYIHSEAAAREQLKMKQISADKILNENSENYEISYGDIAALEFKSSLLGPSRTLQIFTKDNLDSPTYKINLALKTEYMSLFQNFLHNILPNKI